MKRATAIKAANLLDTIDRIDATIDWLYANWNDDNLSCGLLESFVSLAEEKRVQAEKELEDLKDE